MFVLNETYKAVEKSNDPLIGIALFVGLVVIIAFGLYAIYKSK